MRDLPAADVTVLLDAWVAGKPEALGQLMERVYPELHSMAARYFRAESPYHTLQSTALISEAYLRLVQAPPKQWNGRAHFFGFAARVMRGILVDHARARETDKRGGRMPTLVISDTDAASKPREVAILDVNQALDELASLDPNQAQLVELRYFGGLTLEETAGVMNSSVSTVKREWIVAKTWIRRRLLEKDTV